MNVAPFTPQGTVTIAATTSTARGTLPTTTATNRQMRLVSSGSGVGFYKMGDSTVTAAVTDTPFLLGSDSIFSIDATSTNVAIILASGVSATTVYACIGQGL